MVVEKLNDYFDSETDRVFEKDILYPLSLLNHRGLLHLCAYNETDKKIVVVGFDAFLQLSLTNDIFKPNRYIEMYNQFTKTHFGVSQNIDEKVYQIELEIDQVTGHYISLFFWHYDQRFELRKNKKFRMTFSCALNGELVGWVIQWMNNVRVVKPKALLTLVNKIHQECIDFNNHNPSLKHRTLFWKENAR
nr:WYL domain-containing protein [Niabella soli]